MCEILGSSESLPGDGNPLRSDARVETLYSEAVMAYTILRLWFGRTDHAPRCQPASRRPPVPFSRSLVTTSDIPAGASGSSADFGIALPRVESPVGLLPLRAWRRDFHSWRDRM